MSTFLNFTSIFHLYHTLNEKKKTFREPLVLRKMLFAFSDALGTIVFENIVRANLFKKFSFSHTKKLHLQQQQNGNQLKVFRFFSEIGKLRVRWTGR